MLEFRKASRKAVPLICSFSSVSGGGKTLSAILFGSGLLKRGGRLAMLDTENHRGEMYADDDLVKAAIPEGFEYASLEPPFSPDKYIDAIQSAEKAGISVLIMDSGSHEWEGSGGCRDIAANNKLKGMPNWAMAKIAHQKFVNCLLFSQMHIVVCLRAREKVKIESDNSYTQLGLVPITEKNFAYEMMLSLRLDGVTHLPTILKAPGVLRPTFATPHLISKQDGQMVEKWNSQGDKLDEVERLQKRAKFAASDGLESYSKMYESLSVAQKQILFTTTHESNKAQAKLVDEERIRAENEAGFDPDDHIQKESGSTKKPDDVLYGLHLRIEQEGTRLGEQAFAAALKRWGKTFIADITNEFNAEEILADLKQVKS